jgi:omega-6 fatty acid desaturase (delta-12 desaturase)
MTAYPPTLSKCGQDPVITEIRAGLKQFQCKSNALALSLFGFEAALYVAFFIALVVVPASWLVKLPISVLLGVITTRLFILGHDAAHGSLAESRFINAFMGRLALLPSLHPFSLWVVGHNRVHHSFTNLKGRDFIWIPFSPTEYRRLPRWRQRCERFYRSIYGFGIYYLIEIWWKYLSPKGLKALKVMLPIFWVDIGLVVTFFAAEIIIARGAVIVAVIIPFLVWNWLMGFLIYNHHTHPDVRFFDRRSEWRFFEGQIKGTVHVIFPGFMGSLFHNIMEHTAHHFNVNIPLYHLGASQRFLEERFADLLVVEKWSPKRFLATLRCCQLYDYQHHRWVTFAEAMRPAGKAEARSQKSEIRSQELVEV